MVHSKGLRMILEIQFTEYEECAELAWVRPVEHVRFADLSLSRGVVVCSGQGNSGEHLYCLHK